MDPFFLNAEHASARKEARERPIQHQGREDAEGKSGRPAQRCENSRRRHPRQARLCSPPSPTPVPRVRRLGMYPLLGSRFARIHLDIPKITPGISRSALFPGPVGAAKAREARAPAAGLHAYGHFRHLPGRTEALIGQSVYPSSNQHRQGRDRRCLPAEARLLPRAAV